MSVWYNPESLTIADIRRSFEGASEFVVGSPLSSTCAAASSGTTLLASAIVEARYARACEEHDARTREYVGST